MNQSSDHRVILVASCGQSAPLRVTINERARRILLRIDSKKREAVAVVPSKRHRKRALAFAEERVDWIVKCLAALPDPAGMAPGEYTLFRGIEHRIEKATSGRSVRVEMREDSPAILIPGRDDLLASKLKGFLRAEARSELTARVAVHAATLGVKPAGITIKDTRSRWGSCSSAGNLNFSWRLICAPPHVLDYVAAHEVAHLVEMNHSPRFWAQVEKCYGEHKGARKWLNDNGRALHAVGG
ncbi:MAG: hypothetical protein CME88_03745 [Hirschia sp.]|nr:hypothetical protein [Hirschia sp.]MBF17470.1 hypothetical protein [Hirschia sp.]